MTLSYRISSSPYFLWEGTMLIYFLVPDKAKSKVDVPICYNVSYCYEN
jgi:hypothetical protein